MDKNVSKHFKAHEFACKCGCGFHIPRPELVDGLELLRGLASANRGHDTPLSLDSACRCATHNAEVKGKPDSQHLPDEDGYGRAADIKVPAGMTVDILADLAEHVEVFRGGGIGRYYYADDSFVHVDVRHGRARWHEGNPHPPILPLKK